MMRALFSWRRLRWGAGAALGVTALAVLGAWGGLRASLPQLDGEVTAAGLSAPVEVARDADGVPLIKAAARDDGAYALGFLHAQERFFQMDLLRRAAAGELAALVGEEALEQDLSNRRFRFRVRAEQALTRLAPAERRLLDRYVAGVNDGLSHLGARPFEYLLLREAPQPWRPEDSLLATWAMYLVLQGNQEVRELARGWLKDNSTPEQLAWLLPEGSRYDVPLDMAALPTATATLPGSAPAWLGRPTQLASLGTTHKLAVGSNSWALAGSVTAHGGAILANDMHLGIQLPNTWYRAALSHPVEGGGSRRLVGLTLPGVPLFIVGSNGRVAWGFTNSYGDYLDLIEAQADVAGPDRVRLGGVAEAVSTVRERITVRGGEAVTLTVRETRFGPLRERDGRQYVVNWLALHPDAVNLGMVGMESARDIGEAAKVANHAGIPTQNITLADASGRIGWTLAGPLPARPASFRTSFPYAAESAPSWQDAGASHPQVFDPTSQVLWTANSRQLGGEGYARLGDGGADLGMRARQIRDRLLEVRRGQENDAMAIALDTASPLMDEWRMRALAVLTPAALAEKPERAEFRRLLGANWKHNADPEAVAYRLVRAYYFAVYEELFGFVDAELKKLDPNASFEQANPRWGEVALRLLTERPGGWLPFGRDWDRLELAAVDRAIAQLSGDGTALAEARWGERNRADIGHPLASVLPFGRHWLAAPPDPLPGDDHMPRVSAPDFGQSERLVVSPGREEAGLFNMPGGQSGHPLSPFFLAGHDA